MQSKTAQRVLVGVLAGSACGTDVSSAEGGFDTSVTPLPLPTESCPEGTPISEAVCDAEFGSAYTVNTVGDRNRFLVGRWVTCEFEQSSSPFLPDPHAGFEITAEGEFFVLVDDGSGNLVRGAGLDFEATIGAGLNGPDSFWIEGPGEAGFGQAIMVGSECPRKLRLAYIGASHQGEYALLVDP